MSHQCHLLAWTVGFKRVPNQKPQHSLYLVPHQAHTVCIYLLGGQLKCRHMHEAHFMQIAQACRLMVRYAHSSKHTVWVCDIVALHNREEQLLHTEHLSVLQSAHSPLLRIDMKGLCVVLSKEHIWAMWAVWDTVNHHHQECNKSQGGGTKGIMSYWVFSDQINC